ncbi:HET-domain-containing protein [Lentinus tigrinus ALCF2SS1-7]|uniref:HET-domain-containing protein n=1 Tax=Lentinus tigrinus ALCF2SS1-6 TaxID=1328759 RepID=A0A5C2RVG6_9APHY|nr:HET-domain-containing protein [Lentinus tigrinus ALCF2SS1-6]RPD73825.1 HET-domain-containing protein [Lentinus tigrinus ALCF2SS1-7]
MWLLSTDRAELHFFADPEDVEDGYATLSHVWDKEEQSFQDVQKIRKKCARNLTAKGRNPRNFVCEKIRRCCELAESHGYKWVWIDTCCIDKTSSAELSEAINSMFRYYALSSICYAYMRDVTPIAFPDGSPQTYYRARNHLGTSIWFGRGWTLQELVAPRFLLFLSESWTTLGTKADFADILEDDTGIPATVLRLEASYTEYSIAQRMSWYGKRETTRAEDEAYCLLGLFGVHIPPLYGEGRNAFRRLQEEIMKQSTDTTLFAWGGTDKWDENSCLFALTPAWFGRRNMLLRDHECGNIVPDGNARGAENKTFSVTPRGIRAYVPIIECRTRTYADLHWLQSVGGYPVLLCLRSTDNATRQDEDGEDTEWKIGSIRGQPGPPAYEVDRPRLLEIQALSYPGIYTIQGEVVRASWQDVFIKHRPSPRHIPGQLPDSRLPFIPAIPMQLPLHAPYRFDPTDIRKFQRQLDGPEVKIYNPAVPGAPVRYRFRAGHKWTSQWITINVGQCLRKEENPVWATLLVTNHGHKEDSVDHDCQFDHISEWPTRDSSDSGKESANRSSDAVTSHQKDFPLASRKFYHGYKLFREEGGLITLSFAPCPINPARTLVLKASLEVVNRNAPTWQAAAIRYMVLSS